MPSTAPYIPPKNANLIAWAQNFETLIAASPSTYGLTSGDATTITAAYTPLNADYVIISSPTTKTKAAVQAFNTQKVNSLAVLRPYSQQIANNAGVTSSNKVALGLNPRTNTPTPITAPTTNPVLTAQSTSTAGTILRYRDVTASPSVKSKPAGVTQLYLFATASATVITDPTLLTFVGPETKSPFTQAMGAGDAGKTVYFAARWATRKGLMGPWSPVLSYVVAG